MNTSPTAATAFLLDPVDVDSFSVELLADLPGFFAFDVRLSGNPDPIWKRTFERVWKESRYMNKLDAVVLEETIRFICSQKQGMEDYLYLIESRITVVNREMKKYWEERGVPVQTARYLRYPASFRPIGTF